jgi:hypothetical protein
VLHKPPIHQKVKKCKHRAKVKKPQKVASRNNPPHNVPVVNFFFFDYLLELKGAPTGFYNNFFTTTTLTLASNKSAYMNPRKKEKIPLP